MDNILLNDGWFFKDENGEVLKDPAPAEVPGTVYTDLMANKIIPDPFYSDNESKLKWVEEKDWVYTKKFVVSKETVDKKKTALVFEGIDTFADIFLNGHMLGSADNMFRPYVFDVNGLLKEENSLELRFKSPARALSELEKKHGVIMNGPFCTIRGYGRKAQYSFGWDWGPRFPASGLWKGVRLLGYNYAKFDFVYVKQLEVSGKKARIKVQVEADSLMKDDVAVSFEIKGTKCKKTVRHHMIDGTNLIRAEFEIRNPKLWFPHGYGDPHLYEVKVSMKYKDIMLDQRSVKFGLRTIEIAQEKDKEGRGFIFRINGIPVYCKGMNWIPADSFLTRVTKERYRRLLSMMPEANMNMARIWGGGIYEDEEFYDTCDELGIMVWQDFMSGCEEVPDHLEWFNDSFSKEAVFQVKRLRNHPSVVIWSGNNENESSRYYVSQEGRQVKRYYGEALFYRILPEICRLHDPTRPYVPSSPYSPDEFIYMSQKNGDFHSYEGWGGGDWRKFGDIKGRFLSETGYQSFPDIETVAKFAPKEDWDLAGKSILAHEKAYDKPLDWIRFGVEEVLGFKPAGFEDFVYYSQVNWAEGSKFSIEHWRRRKFITSGILFWQLNDCWPVISWVFVDYYYRPKLCYFSAKRAFSPVIVSPVLESGKVKVNLINDELVPFKGRLVLRLLDFSGTEYYRSEVSAQCPANSNKLIFSRGITVDDPKTRVLVVDLVRGKELVFRNFLFFEKLGNLSLKRAELEAEVKPGSGCVKLILKADTFAPAIKVSADADGAQYSDNYLFLLPGEKKEITISSAEKITRITIRGLNTSKWLTL